MKKLSKQEAKKEIEEFFENLKEKSPNEIKKIKRFAMRHSIKLGNFRKKFCKKCFSTKFKILSVKKGIKRIQCEDCGYTGRWKMK